MRMAKGKGHPELAARLAEKSQISARVGRERVGVGVDAESCNIVRRGRGLRRRCNDIGKREERWAA